MLFVGVEICLLVEGLERGIEWSDIARHPSLVPSAVDLMIVIEVPSKTRMLPVWL